MAGSADWDCEDMFGFLWVLSAIIILILFAFFHRWRVTVRYVKNVFTVDVGNFTVYSSAKGKKDDKYIKTPKLSFKELTDKYGALKAFYRDEKCEIVSILQEAQRRFDIKKLNFSVDFGFGDAAVTGIASGFLWGCVGGASAFLKKYWELDKKLNIALCPQFTKTCFEMNINLIFYSRPIKMIEIVKRIVRLCKRNRERLSVFN
ncbi:MAG: hypothetical protein BWY15_00041 [Firmicutes bacterium ADurb.Bin193]|nr:MAG: hypothetical protein BWY15_00041 [Firmicutes bacterium ADurb.Bin193]